MSNRWLEVSCAACSKSTVLQTYTQPGWPSGILERWTGWCGACFEREQPDVTIATNADFDTFKDLTTKLTDSWPEKLGAFGRDIKGALVGLGVPLDVARRIHVQYHEYLNNQKSRRKSQDGGRHSLSAITEAVLKDRVTCLLDSTVVELVDKCCGPGTHVILDTTTLVPADTAPVEGAHGRYVAVRADIKIVMPDGSP